MELTVLCQQAHGSKGIIGKLTTEEKNADMFASSLLLPKEGVYAMISNEEILKHKINLATILRIEQMFQVSRHMLLIRLKNIGIIAEKELLALVKQVMADESLKYCPHGRPICVSLSKKQLEKQFKRT